MTNHSPAIIPDWPAQKHVRALTTIKSVWGKRTNPYPDIPASDELVSLFQLPAPPAWVLQRHTNIAIPAPFVSSHTSSTPIADATFTNTPGCVLAILTADCLPILLCDNEGEHIAAIHAGWRGLAAGIIENTIHAMNNAFGPKNYMAWMGPAIGPQKFEVGEEVYDTFIKHDPKATLAFTPINHEQHPKKWLANLYLLATQRLQDINIHPIYGGVHCTYTEADLFFSYRRDHGKTGRMASVIWIEK